MTRTLEWAGRVIAVQPRIRLTRSFDERSHTYLGFVLRLDGQVGNERRRFSVGVGRATHDRHQFEVGQQVSGRAEPAADPTLEPAEFYKASALRVDVQHRAVPDPPPWWGVPPSLEVYRSRGHRRLAAKTYAAHCASCIWGCRMPVELIVDHWHPEQRRSRVETFCYGPKSCARYRAGPTRKVPGRRGMSWEEEDWVDDEATAHRGLDD